MKKILPFLFLALFVGTLVLVFISLASTKKMVVVQEGNFAQLPLEMRAGLYQDSDCGMVIDDLRDASQIISKDGKSWFFHDHGGLVRWLEDKDLKDDVKIWVMSRDTKRFINAKEAYYSLSDETAMGYGFGAYENNREGLITFDIMRLRMLRGETLRNPLIRKKLLNKEN